MSRQLLQRKRHSPQSLNLLSPIFTSHSSGEDQQQVSDKLTVGRTYRPVCWWTQREEFIEGKLSLWHTDKTELAWDDQHYNEVMQLNSLTLWHHSLQSAAHSSSHFGSVMKYLLCWSQGPPVVLSGSFISWPMRHHVTQADSLCLLIPTSMCTRWFNDCKTINRLYYMEIIIIA